MKTSGDDSAKLAKTLMGEFAEQTGLRGSKEADQDRYLWTDAFAVHNFLALASYFDDQRCKELARQLIESVHYTLGRFSPDDSRSGWISSLPEKEAQQHPTVNGLRIGKSQPERKESEPFDSNKEWDRDGQYYHYHTRWIHALLQAADYLGNQEYIKHAAELSLAGRHFLNQEGNQQQLYWKMSIDLTYPLVPSMGAHDPLDGYLTALECKMMASDKRDFTEYLENLEAICKGKNWKTTDPLGLGGLLLNTVRSAELESHTDLPESVHPQKLYRDALNGLDAFVSQAGLDSSAKFRLAFRECGLSLGLRVIESYRGKLTKNRADAELLDEYLNLADDIENFWSERQNREYTAYRNHQNINHVSLAASLLARTAPAFFSRPYLNK